MDTTAAGKHGFVRLRFLSSGAQPVPLAAEVKPLVAGIIGYVVLVLVHPYIADAPAFAG